ncbi:nucleotide exchange factor GrpE [Paenibacillus alkalitolerans]|uniref:nucleotide exchange factor GrpE n=1 Tax=Paenibacillus alkalitolerans TaxID=2799335 RepID=UPI0018F777E1|nr:nucleotide exchange factor GrpE [Paenibacillus alkalitolerans]
MWNRLIKRKPSKQEEALHRLEQTWLEQSQTIGEQLGKMTRLQYKSHQETQSKLDKLIEQIETGLDWEKAFRLAEAESSELKAKLTQAADTLIRWLDDLDAVQSRMESEEHDAWRQLLSQWSTQLIHQLELWDIWEIRVIGRTFDPVYCEAVGTAARDETNANAEPYQIVEVVRRGFRHTDGRLLRKAQVITLEANE